MGRTDRFGFRGSHAGQIATNYAVRGNHVTRLLKGLLGSYRRLARPTAQGLRRSGCDRRGLCWFSGSEGDAGFAVHGTSSNCEVTAVAKRDELISVRVWLGTDTRCGATLSQQTGGIRTELARENTDHLNGS
jgi:hypothetical protein